ncbi:hypothetical protein VQ042_17900 [Aurantimonas sp. A2-1-M11]|uniref:hypothetical protein n=1 Tax=Aurantimonas sp. A2-1-M11 TaxID=3113712 RepID=UPI002F9296C4
MTKHHHLVAQTVTAANGEIVGRVRMQKVFYLLEQLGLGSGLSFSYHHYGPYSRALDEAIDASKAFDGLKEEMRNRVSDGAPFSVFIAQQKANSADGKIGNISAGDAAVLLERMKAASSTVIELAATIHWLATKECVPDWRSELRRRKGVKTEGGRTEQAIALLDQLGLVAEIPMALPHAGAA